MKQSIRKLEIITDIPPICLFPFSFLLVCISSSIAATTTTAAVAAAATSDISLGSALYATNSKRAWSSPNNSFSLRFLPVNSSAYTLSITYDSIPIWTAGSNSAIVGSEASFHLLPNGDLRLLTGSRTVIWRSNTSGLGVSYANLDDSGNFILKNASGNTIWSTFDNPTDTVVPSQNLTVGKALKSGVYSLFLSGAGTITLQWGNSMVYWSSGLNASDSLINPWLALSSIGILSVYDAHLPGSVLMVYSSDYAEYGDILRFLKLDNDGNLRIYSSVRGSGTATVRWTAVADQCLVFGYCGNMGICSFSDNMPVCRCPSWNFQPIDLNDSRKGCMLKKEIKDCSGNETVLQMDHTRFLTYPPETDAYFDTTSDCRQNCLLDAACVASSTLGDGSGKCYMKKSSFVSGYQSTAITSSSLVKVCAPALPNPPPSSGKKLKGWIIAVAVLGTVMTLVILEGSLWWWWCRKNPRFGGLEAQYTPLDYASSAPIQFSYRELLRATKGFKKKLGAGGFGAVYKGVLANTTVVAVKQLEGIEQGEKQFRMEVATISSTHHLNLVRLIGFCCEGRHRLLVYEFMKNGSLDSFLFMSESESGKQLSWEHRFNIALNTARGITYLHEECRECIVHCDIKPENILLDDNYNAKVSDFGLAKLINPKDQRYSTLTSVRGTRGYLAPEWLANVPVAPKHDVYSYGMLLLEIVSGRRNFQVVAETSGKKFFIWAYEEFEKGNVACILDKRLAECQVDMDQVTRAIQVSFWCIQEQPSQRPTMRKVVQMLEGIMEIKKTPAPKAVSDSINSNTSSISISALSTYSSACLGPSLCSSFKTARVSSLSSMNVEMQQLSSLVPANQKIFSS